MPSDCNKKSIFKRTICGIRWWTGFCIPFGIRFRFACRATGRCFLTWSGWMMMTAKMVVMTSRNGTSAVTTTTASSGSRSRCDRNIAVTSSNTAIIRSRWRCWGFLAGRRTAGCTVIGFRLSWLTCGSCWTRADASCWMWETIRAGWWRSCSFCNR